MGFRWLVTMALAALLAPSGCAERAEFAPRVERAFAPASPETTRRVVLITIDGVRWQEIFGGVDPRLAEEARLPRSAMVGSNALLPSIRRLFFEHGTALGDPRLGGGIEASARPRLRKLFTELESLTEFAGSKQAALERPAYWLAQLAEQRAQAWLALAE